MSHPFRKAFPWLAIGLGIVALAWALAFERLPPADFSFDNGNEIQTADPAKATEQELRGQELFFGKAQCSTCHPAPYYTDNLMHNLQVERFYEPQMINGRFASADGPIKTFPLRGIKDSPPYLHDGRCPTLHDAVEFFNIIFELRLSQQEKEDLVAYMLCL